ncbi:Imm51 family immunity protein [Flammeovirga sp. SJP92]|uniref:Imm51 family immunity protein n=1 Tax=Flammeovirga sp. SJP92 TaxID=1775430 RepID=UPI0007878349|nr:Imm51 family immunity protein [Flammeovirga sp. SJP92]KXX70332.1 hypothetical protein AVL50_12050 [Flammeovirga sp. SJP92]
MKTDFVDYFISEEYQSISVRFEIERPAPLMLGERMNEVNEMAYMNGYNWAALLELKLKLKDTSLLNEFTMDPEAGSCFISCHNLNDSNIEKAKKIVAIITDVVNNEDETLDFLKEYGEEIEWD